MDFTPNIEIYFSAFVYLVVLIDSIHEEHISIEYSAQYEQLLQLIVFKTCKFLTLGLWLNSFPPIHIDLLKLQRLW